MAITNRALDASEQRRSHVTNYGISGTGLTLPVMHIPFNSTLEAIKVAAFSLSGSPTLDFAIDRFIVGTGFTTIIAGFTTLTASAYGTSGPQSVVMVASGNTLLNLLAGDVLKVATGGSNTAAAYSIGVAIRAAQDIKTVFGA